MAMVKGTGRRRGMALVHGITGALDEVRALAASGGGQAVTAGGRMRRRNAETLDRIADALSDGLGVALHRGSESGLSNLVDKFEAVLSDDEHQGERLALWGVSGQAGQEAAKGFDGACRTLLSALEFMVAEYRDGRYRESVGWDRTSRWLEGSGRGIGESIDQHRAQGDAIARQVWHMHGTVCALPRADQRQLVGIWESMREHFHDAERIRRLGETLHAHLPTKSADIAAGGQAVERALAVSAIAQLGMRILSRHGKECADGADLSEALRSWCEVGGTAEYVTAQGRGRSAFDPMRAFR